jgi:hypothetical protein
VGVPVAEHEGEAIAVAVALLDGEGVADALAVAVAVLEGEALVVGVQLVVGEGVQEGLGLAVVVAVLEGDALAEAEAEGVAVAVVLGVAVDVALWVGPQLVVVAAATPPHDPANAANAADTIRVASPVARAICPAHCSFSQLRCRDRRKIVTIPWIVRLVHPGSQVPRSLHQCPASLIAG